MATKSRTKHSNKKSLANEVIAVLLVAAAILLLLSLVTYDPRDPSANQVGATQTPRNVIGVAGAYFGDLFLTLFGLASFVIPPLLVVIAARAFFSKQAGIPIRKVSGAVLLLLALSGFLALFGKLNISLLLRYSSNGGAVGYIIVAALTSIMGSTGAAIVLTVAALLTIMLTMEISLAAIGAWLKQLTEARAEQRKGQPTLLERFKAWRAERAEHHRIIVEERRERKEQERKLREEEKAKRQREEQAELEREQKAREMEERRRKQEALRPKAVPVIEKRSTAEPVLSSVAIANAGDAAATVSGAPLAGSIDAVDEAEDADEAPAISPTRSRARADIQARIAKIEQARAGRSLASQITMDPDVAEMTSTAWIDRTVPADAQKTKSQPARRRTTIETSTGVAYKLPSIDLLEPPIGHQEEAEEELRERAQILAEKCKEFAVTGHIHRINPGPVVTTFEFKPDPGIKYSRVVSLADDLCLALKAESIRIDRIPGKSTVGIEVPNTRREKIFLRDVVESSKFQQSESKLSIALGKTINGDEYIADLARMPHLLIAGATGAGKSVTLNAIILSILYKASPEEVKFIMVDPKRVELGLYEGIPHLLTPIVTDPKRAANALKWAVNEMENRYRELATVGVRNIEQYNRYVREITHPTASDDNGEAPRPLPYIVIAIDELADLMMVARSEVETSIARLAQMARAVGIHLVLATQRPSVDIITGVIKANIPSRIAFRVSQKVDSRTIIDANGAEALLGQGDMLFLPPASARLVRVHGSYASEAEIKKITDHTRKQAEPQYNEQVTLSEQEAEASGEFDGEQDDMFDEALVIVTDMGRASTSVLQRRLSIGYGRAAKILDQMERQGFIGPAEGSKPRKVLQAAYEFRDRVEQRLEEPFE
ncbi:MAG TPA: DNA translocase FtsK [Blastocatellia bacterium]|nr:DNA translocase FtsK [Blastocatellia bacterium]